MLWPLKTSRAGLQQYGRHPETDIALLQDKADDGFEDLTKTQDLKMIGIEAEGSDIEYTYIVDARKEIEALMKENVDSFTVGEWEEDEAYRRQNPITIPVREIAIHLKNLFETSPDCEAEGIVLKMFRWLTGRPTFESACHDMRSMTAKGIQNDLQLRPFLCTAIVSPEEQAYIDRF